MGDPELEKAGEDQCAFVVVQFHTEETV
jgi:hypothetical protein